MKILYIDTSSSYLYAGISEKDTLVCEVKKEFGHNLSEEALPAIVSMFTQNNIDPKDINKIIVVNGPGSFTGIRIGITIAKVYAWSLNIPITTITSLEAMAISSKSNKIHVPMIDARRQYVFGAIYDENNNVILNPQHIKITNLEEKLNELTNYVIITNDEIDYFKAKETYDPDILKIIQTYKDNKPINPHAVNPDYLKLTEAEESKLS